MPNNGSTYDSSDKRVPFSRWVDNVREDFVRNKNNYKKQIQKRLTSIDVVAVNLVGSYMNGNATEDSDIDLGIWYKGKRAPSYVKHSLYDTIINKYTKQPFDLRVVQLQSNGKFCDDDEWFNKVERDMMNAKIRLKGNEAYA